MRKLLWILVDVALVMVFAAIGRASHAETLDAAGVGRTALPFLAGTLLAWVYLVVRRPKQGLVAEGILVWAVTLVFGMMFRTMLGDGVQVGFVLVTAAVLAALLIGWRALLHLARRGRSASTAGKGKDPRRSGNPARRDQRSGR